MRILVANRGEIARRVIRTASRMGLETVAAYADPDAHSPFVAEASMAVRIGPADLSRSYLSIDVLLDAAGRTRAEAVHPGYGFLSENADFARAVGEAGLVWIGPSAEAIEQMGSKIEARRLAQAAGVPVIPGFDADQDPAELADAAAEIGYPVLIKAAAGGGGKGIRMVDGPGRFAARLDEARTEALRSFGNGDVIVERYIQRPRHVEVQVVGDRHGGVIDLGTRECSVQRRYQKILEEAPAPNLPERTRTGLRAAARDLARSIGYDSAGTVEFVVDDDTGDPFFLEMNTRLQVEHTVTEEVTGLDIVELQIRSARGESLPIDQSDVAISGHAFEARVNAEDAGNGFTPQVGRISHLDVPAWVRWDSGVELGSEIGPHYDSMIAKLIVHGADRDQALARLRSALEELIVGGIVSTAGFHRWLVDQEPVVEGKVTTRFLDETDLPGPVDQTQAAGVAGTGWCRTRDEARSKGPWGALVGYRTTPHSGLRSVALVDLAGMVHDTTVSPARLREAPERPTTVDLANSSVAVNISGHTHTFGVLSRSERWAPSAGTGHGHAAAIVAPFPAVVADIPVKTGDRVAGGDVVVVIEAMKMLHSLTAVGPGVVDEIRVVEGDQVESRQVLVTFDTGETTGTATATDESAGEGRAPTGDMTEGGGS
jgi:acetyl/propionyl-CoA carboxylase alpha subunit